MQSDGEREAKTSDEAGASGYIVVLNDVATEALSFAPLATGGGWARYFPPPDPDADWYVGFIRLGLRPPALQAGSDAGPICVREYHVMVERTSVAITSAREIPFGRIERAVNQSRHYHALLPYMDSRRFGDPIPAGEGIRNMWRVELPALIDVRPPLQLDLPEGRQRKPDQFYRQVAEAFTWLAARSSRPAEDLAGLNDVAVTTVHRWVREARNRGALPPATGRGTRRKGGEE